MTLTEAEQQFLAAQRHGHLATIGRGGGPQVKPVGFSYNAALGTIDIAGFNMGLSAKYKNVQANPQVAFAADDVPDPEAGAAGVRLLEIRGLAEAVTAEPGDGQPSHAGQLGAEIIRIHPRRVLSFNVEGPGLRTRDIGGITTRDERWPA